MRPFTILCVFLANCRNACMMENGAGTIALNRNSGKLMDWKTQEVNAMGLSFLRIIFAFNCQHNILHFETS